MPDTPLLVVQGQPLDLTISTRRPDGTPRNLAGARVLVQFRSRWSDELLATAVYRILTPPTDGILVVRVEGADTAQIPEGVVAYDAWLLDAPTSGDAFGAVRLPERLLGGWASVERRVSVEVAP